MNSSSSVAANLSNDARKGLAILSLSKAEPIARLADREGVSRQFVYRQKQKAAEALDEAFAAKGDDVLFHLPVTEAWLNQLTLALILICRSSYRGVKELLRDLFNISISVGTIHNRLQSAAAQACAINRSQNLSAIRVGLHDEIFQGSMPVLAGVDAASTYCYLLADAEHRDADTWAVHLLDANAQGFDPDHTIADAGQGLRSGQKAALGDTPCHGDVFHIQKQCESLANVLARVAMGATSRRKALDAKMDAAKENMLREYAIGATDACAPNRKANVPIGQGREDAGSLVGSRYFGAGRSCSGGTPSVIRFHRCRTAASRAP